MAHPLVRSLIVGIIAFAVVMPLRAQKMADTSTTQAVEAGQTIAEVRTDGGVVMISEGGSYQTAVQGQRVKGNANLMVSKESAATVVYDDGCKQTYDKPGIYKIAETCVLPAAVAGGSGPSKALIAGGILLGGDAVAAIIDHYNDDGDDTPISR
jgi:imidazole glycerol phosphate synthase subunit HisF